MINPTLKGLVKIGRTKWSSKNRVLELRSTGLPDDFIVVYDELVTDSIFVEKNYINDLMIIVINEIVSFSKFQYAMLFEHY